MNGVMVQSSPQPAKALTVERVFLAIRDRICLLSYPPGSVLSENKLAAEFGVSRTPIRQALQRLEFDHLVSSQHGVGTIVTSLDLPYLKQVYALRLKLIDLVAELSPGHATSADFAALETLLEQSQALYSQRQPKELARVYLRFNEALSVAIGNAPLREIADRLFYQTSRLWLQILPEMPWQDEVGYIGDEITRVLAALRAEDMRQVATVRREHMLLCLRRISHSLGDIYFSEITR